MQMQYYDATGTHGTLPNDREWFLYFNESPLAVPVDINNCSQHASNIGDPSKLAEMARRKSPAFLNLKRFLLYLVSHAT